MGSRRFSFSLVVVALLLLIAPAAHAALFLIFETRSYQPDGYVIPRTGGIGSPGDLVRARTGGRGAVSAGAVMPAFLAAGGYPSEIESVSDLEAIEGLTPVGELRADDKGNGRLTFRTPNLSPGDYQIVLYCKSCAAFSAGHNVVGVAPFRITGSDESITDASTFEPMWIGVVLLTAAVTFFILKRHKRANTSDSSPEAP